MANPTGDPTTLDEYLDWVSTPSDALLRRLEDEARAAGVPIVGRRTARLIELFARVVQPELIVELGTATGYSGILILRGWQQARLITFEVDEDRATQARRNFDLAGYSEQADVRVENAVEGLERLSPASAGIVFNDLLNGLRDEQRVERCFLAALNVLKPRGLLIADNALAGGDVLRGDTHQGRCVRRWNELVLGDPSLTATIVPIEDGLSIAVRN